MCSRQNGIWLLLGIWATFWLTGTSGSSGCLTGYEYLECQPNATQECYAGPDTTVGVGICKRGIRRCSQNGAWSACEEQVVPSKEICDGQDNDCNGKIDDLMETPKCAKQQGVCLGATQTCTGQEMTSCTDANYKSHHPAHAPEETSAHCDGLDNDCDGEIDEGCDCKDGAQRECYEAKEGCTTSGSGGSYQCNGLCRAGKQTCQQGKWSACQGTVIPQKEECNGKDDNCDGQIDEGCACTPGSTQPCGTSEKGECKKGQQTCNAQGSWGVCQGATTPQTESCDGKDNDCNGKIDDRADGSALQQTCYTGAATTQNKGPCRAGIQRCQQGQWNPCEGQIVPQPEICNGQDDDCNGNIDDGKNLCPASEVCAAGGVCRPEPEQTLRSGSFVGASGHKVSGDAKVLKGPQGERVVFEANFSSDSGPALYIYLVKDPNGTPTENPKNYLDLGTIKNTKGMQSYNIPQGESATNYQSVTVWCRPFRVNFGFARLHP